RRIEPHSRADHPSDASREAELRQQDGLRSPSRRLPAVAALAPIAARCRTPRAARSQGRATRRDVRSVRTQLTEGVRTRRYGAALPAHCARGPSAVAEPPPRGHGKPPCPSPAREPG